MNEIPIHFKKELLFKKLRSYFNTNDPLYFHVSHELKKLPLTPEEKEIIETFDKVQNQRVEEIRADSE